MIPSAWSYSAKILWQNIRGIRSFRKAQLHLQQVVADGQPDLYHEMRSLMARTAIPGKCFLISDCLYEHEIQLSMLNYLRSRNFEISLLQVMSPTERSLPVDGAQKVIDSETGEEFEMLVDAGLAKEYAQKLAEHIHVTQDFCSSAGIHYIQVTSDEDLSDVVTRRFPATGVIS